VLRKEHAFLYSIRNFKPFSAILRGRYILRPCCMRAVAGGSPRSSAMAALFVFATRFLNAAVET
jgi:hypothetical protein